jgi:fumarylpyruvate hydrolase
MSDLLFPLIAPRVPIHGGGHFPVGRIFCVGRNYAAHAREMGADPTAEPPIFFMKPASAIVAKPTLLPFPRDTADLHHEVELVLALHQGGVDIAESEALGCIFGYAVGIDLTKRDRQGEAKNKGQPWERAKSFDASAPISTIAPAATIGHPARARIALSVNGQSRQAADIAEMIWPPAAIIAHLSRLWRLAPGDVVFTGTPEGVGPVQAGERVTASIDSVGDIDFQFAETA